MSDEEQLRKVVEALATGFLIRVIHHGGHDGYSYEVQKCERFEIRGFLIEQMIKQGWLDGFNGGFRLSDEGHKAYMRSTDELGDGKLIAPGTAT